MPTLYVPDQRQVRPTKATPDVRIPQGAFSADYRAMSQLGGTIQRAGEQFGDVALHIQTVDKANAEAKGREAYSVFKAEWKAGLVSNTDYVNWSKEWAEASDTFSKNYLDGVESPGGKERLGRFFDNENAVEAAKIGVDGKIMLNREYAKRLPFLMADSIEHELDEAEDSPQRLAHRDDFERKMKEAADAGTITPATVPLLMRGRAMDLVKRAADDDPAGVVQALDEKDLSLYLTDADIKLLSPDDIDALRSDARQELAAANRKVALAEEARKQQVTVRRTEISRAIGAAKTAAQMTEDYPKIYDEIYAEPLFDDIDHSVLINRLNTKMDRLTKGQKDIISDPRSLAELGKQALDISTGAVNRADFVKAVDNARYGRNPTINDADFEALMKSANTQHKTYQANAMKEAIDYAEEQLLSKTQIEVIAAAQVSLDEDYETVLKRLGSQRKLEQENFSQFKRAMSEWFEAEKEADREPTDDDIYVKSRKMAAHYRKRKLDEDIYGAEVGTADEPALNVAGMFVSMPQTIGEFARPGKPKEAAKQAGKKKITEGTIAIGPGGIEVGKYNTEGKLELNIAGIRVLREQTGGDIVLARKIMEQNGWVTPK